MATSAGRQTSSRRYHQRSSQRFRETLEDLSPADYRNDAALLERRRRRREPCARRRSVLAALDCGNNNCRLLIARRHEETFRVIDALEVCAKKMRRRDVTLSLVVATEVSRRAQNCEAFIEGVKRETGLEREIISKREEVELALVGCIHS